MAAKQDRRAQILVGLEKRDVFGSAYPAAVVNPYDRLRWNQAHLIAIAIFHTFEPSMLPGEYKQDLHVMAISIYGQSRTSFPTGTAAELAEEVGAAVERGWL